MLQDWMECMPKLDDWSGLEEEADHEEVEFKQKAQQQKQDDYEITLIFNLLNNNKEAWKLIKSKFVDTAIAVPGDDMLQIGLRQGAANLVKWLENKAAEKN